MRRFISIMVCMTLSLAVAAQEKNYTVANAHSHNDYAQQHPFTTAYNAGFGSIEADILLWHDSLIVGHSFHDTLYRRTIQSLYLDSLQEKLKMHKGYPYKDSSRYLQLMIDIKTDSIATLKKLVAILSTYPDLITAHHLYFTISGNRPSPDSFNTYPSFIWFDADMQRTYNAQAMKKIVMISDDLKNYTKWNGKTELSALDKKVLLSKIDEIHRLQKKVRFWDAPDFPQAWAQLMQLKVDFINTDNIDQLSDFFKSYHD